MRRTVALLTLVLCLTALIIEPQLFGQSDEAVAKIQSTVKQLQLTPQQELKLLPILKEEAPRLEAIKNNGSLSGPEKKKQLRAIHEESAAEVQKILTPTQYERLQALREKNIRHAI